MTGWLHRIAAFCLLLAASLAGAFAQMPVPPSDNVPFFDTARKPERPDLTGLRAIRFLTDDDYPPFHFPGPDGQLTGFNVDLARAICLELKLACTIQARRWETLIPSLEDGRGDAIIASMADTDVARARIDFGVPYYRSPGRFVSRNDSGLSAGGVADIGERSVAVIAGSAHAAFLATFFPRAKQVTAPDQDEALKLLTSGKADAMFGDGVGLALWLNGQNGQNCCRFIGGSYFESRYFGGGAAMAFRRDGAQLRKAVDFALFRLAEQGIYQNLMLKYFPVSFY
jgi:polar amino acid transport system substrate-binding protein